MYINYCNQKRETNSSNQNTGNIISDDRWAYLRYPQRKWTSSAGCCLRLSFEGNMYGHGSLMISIERPKGRSGLQTWVNKLAPDKKKLVVSSRKQCSICSSSLISWSLSLASKPGGSQPPCKIPPHAPAKGGDWHKLGPLEIGFGIAPCVDACGCHKKVVPMWGCTQECILIEDQLGQPHSCMKEMRCILKLYSKWRIQVWFPDHQFPLHRCSSHLDTQIIR